MFAFAVHYITKIRADKEVKAPTQGSASLRWGEARTNMHRLVSIQDLIWCTVIRKGKKYIFKLFFLTVRYGTKKDALLTRQSGRQEDQETFTWFHILSVETT